MKRILAFVIANLILVGFSSIAYLLIGYGNDLIYFLFVVFFAAAFAAYAVYKYSFIQSFKYLFYAGCISLFATAFFAAKAFFCNGSDYLHPLEKTSNALEKAKAYLYVTLDLPQLQLDTNFHGTNTPERSDYREHYAVPATDGQGKPLALLYLLGGLRGNYLDQHCFQVANGDYSSKAYINNSGIRYHAETFLGLTSKDTLPIILIAIDFDPIWWRSFWRVALVAAFTVYALLLLVIIPKIIK